MQRRFGQNCFITGKRRGNKLCELLEPTRNAEVVHTAVIIASKMAVVYVTSQFIKKHWFPVLWLN